MYTTDVIVMPSSISALAMARVFSERGVRVICADTKLSTHGMRSMYCSKKLLIPDIDTQSDHALTALEEFGNTLEERAVLYPASDRSVLFLSENRARLSKFYRFVLPRHDLLEVLINKEKMFRIAIENGLSAPKTFVPSGIEEVMSISNQVKYPVLLKVGRSDSPLIKLEIKMERVNNPEELLTRYRTLSEVDRDIMIQEYIPGEDDNMHIYAAYFDRNGQPNMVFTGKKLRQSPINFGAGTLCVAQENPILEKQMTAFCRTIGYRGLIDVGLKWDSRDGQYKALDINPRVGQNFRTFVSSKDKIDMVTGMYLDLVGTPVKSFAPLLGRKWIIEDEDLRSSIKYIFAGRLSVYDWLRSYRGVEECVFFSWKDWRPWVHRYAVTISGVLISVGSRIKKAFVRQN